MQDIDRECTSWTTLPSKQLEANKGKSQATGEKEAWSKESGGCGQEGKPRGEPAGPEDSDQESDKGQMHAQQPTPEA